MKKIISLLIISLFVFGGIIWNQTAQAANLVTNGDFELPEVTNSGKWQVFPSGTAGLEWTVEWAGEYAGAPAIANIELHEGVLMAAYSGDQSVEMDTDWTSANNEKASIKIYQDIETCVGGEYTLSYAWSPRPGHTDNKMEVRWGGSLVGNHSGSVSGWQLETLTGLTSSGATTRIEFVETGNPDSLGMFLDAVSVEQTKDCMVREAGITSPADGATVTGSVNFTAYLIDDDQDSIQWAVRKGTCAAGQGTVFGNVDGYNDAYTWNYDAGTYTHNFSATADTCEWDPGDYCFVFNPTEDTGESDIRLTREFVVAFCDEDEDGISDSDDKCVGTDPDILKEELGTNRWMWDGDSWKTVASKGTGPSFTPNFTYTYGCSCKQILDKMSKITGSEFGGHYKFGCSKSILEDWNRGTYYIGPTFVETVVVPASSLTAISSINILETGKDYFLKAYGTANAGDSIEFDAKYSFRTPTSIDWTDLVSTYESYGPQLLDLFVDGINVDWGAYNPGHTYQIPYAGASNAALFLVNDIYPYNNTGNLSVDIIEDKWVDLW